MSQETLRSRNFPEELIPSLPRGTEILLLPERAKIPQSTVKLRFPNLLRVLRSSNLMRVKRSPTFQANGDPPISSDYGDPQLPKSTERPIFLMTSNFSLLPQRTRLLNHMKCTIYCKINGLLNEFPSFWFLSSLILFTPNMSNSTRYLLKLSVLFSRRRSISNMVWRNPPAPAEET